MTKKAYRGEYRIQASTNISPGVFELQIVASEIAKAASAGQFVNIYLPGGDMLLPRPIGIADSTGDTLVLVYAVVGNGTKALTCYKNGDFIELMGPMGTGFFDYPGSPADKTETGGSARVDEVLLIGGGTGVPPLHFAARMLKQINGGPLKLTACLGFSAEPWYRGDFEEVCDEVRISSEAEGTADFHGNVIELLDMVYQENRPSMALACGPGPMLAAASKWCDDRDIPLRVSLEERMGCGYGACAGCTIATRPLNDANKPQNGPEAPEIKGIVKKKVCVHGPVFWADEVVW